MFVPTLVSEREPDGTWEDCTWASGVMFANGVAGADVHPQTRAEYEALRVAGGDGPAENSGDGSNLGQLATGLERRYGLTTFRRGRGWADLARLAPVGTYVALQGLAGALPARLQVTSFRGAHCVLLARDRDLSSAWLDPLNAKGTPATRIATDEARAFYEALPGAEWLISTATGRSTNVAIIERRELGDVAAGARIHEFPGGPPIGVPFSKPAIVETVGVPMDNSPDHKNLGWRAVRVTTAALDGVLDEKIVYMLTESLANLRPPEPGEGPSGDAIAAATLAGRELEWQRWHDSMGIPDRPGGDDA